MTGHGLHEAQAQVAPAEGALQIGRKLRQVRDHQLEPDERTEDATHHEAPELLGEAGRAAVGVPQQAAIASGREV